MQLIEILSAFSKAEVNALDNAVQAHKRKSLTALYRYLKVLNKGKAEFDRDTAFIQVFGEHWNRKKDYMLKNEVRNLKQVIYTFLARQEFERRLKEEPNFYKEWTLAGIASRHLEQVFEVEWDKAFEPKANMYKPAHIAALYELKSNFHIRHSFESKLSDREHLAMLDDWIALEKKRLLYNIREIEGAKAFLLRAQALKKDAMDSFHKHLNFEQLDVVELKGQRDMWTRYQELSRDSYLLRDWDRINALKEALSLFHKSGNRFPVDRKDEISLLFNIGSGLIALKDVEQGAVFLEKSVQCAIKQKAELPVSIHYMRMVVYIHLCKYHEGIEYYKANRAAITSNAFYLPATVQLSYCYLFLGDTIGAVRCFPEKDPSLQGKGRTPWRFVKAISFIIDKEYEQAIREVANLKRYLAQQPATKNSHRLTANLLTKYLKALVAHTDKRQDLINALRYEVSGIDISMELSLVPFHWIKKQLLVSSVS